MHFSLPSFRSGATGILRCRSLAPVTRFTAQQPPAEGMVSFMTSSLLLLQAAVLISSAAARCTPRGASDTLLVLLRAHARSHIEQEEG
jgi:hypothetical protein